MMLRQVAHELHLEAQLRLMEVLNWSAEDVCVSAMQSRGSSHRANE